MEGGTTMQPITLSYKTLHVVHQQHMHRKVNKTHYSISIDTIYIGACLAQREC
jgi:hypothetical protein